jgi:histidinol-phosphatase (PHP family)
MKMITDVHTHSDFSFDGSEPLSSILEEAYRRGVSFYGVSEHYEYEFFIDGKNQKTLAVSEEEYFHRARHLQEDYEGAMNVLIGMEFGFDDREEACTMYEDICKKYHPDFVVNSIHTIRGNDYYFGHNYGEKRETYLTYLAAVRKSLDAPYPYDIVGHIGYVTRYAPYEDKAMRLADYQAEIDDILLTIIKKDKILEVNSSNKDGLCLPTAEIIKRYYELGGRKISYASDTHNSVRIADKREEVVAFLKEVGFTYITVPCKGEHIKVEI